MVLARVLAALFSSGCFGVVFHVRGRKLFYAAVSGGLGYLVYLLPLPVSTVASIFLASCAITVYSEVMARVEKAPATVFLIAGLIPIVPGGGMYRCMYQALEGDLYQAAITCYETLLEAGAIAIGVVTVTSIVKTVFTLRRAWRIKRGLAR